MLKGHSSQLKVPNAILYSMLYIIARTLHYRRDSALRIELHHLAEIELVKFLPCMM